MKIIKYIIILMLLTSSIACFSQTNLNIDYFFNSAINHAEHGSFRAAEEDFRKSQELLLKKGLNDSTIVAFCNILYHRAYNLFQIEELLDSSYVCFKELYEISKQNENVDLFLPYKVESVLMLSNLDLINGKIKDGCFLLEKEKYFIDSLDDEKMLTCKYLFYKNLARFYCNVYISLYGDASVWRNLTSNYSIFKSASNYTDYISVYKKLVELSELYNKSDKKKQTEDMVLLAEHCKIPDDNSLALKSYEKAFLLWSDTEEHNCINYLNLCKSFLSYTNKAHILNTQKQKIQCEFDDFLNSDSADSLSLITLMDLYSVRLEDEDLTNDKKEFFVKKICDKIVSMDNYDISFFLCGFLRINYMLSLDYMKILIKYLSLSSIYYYEKEDFARADLLLNKAKYFSMFFSEGDRIMFKNLNDAIAKSAEIICDDETNYNFKNINFVCKIAQGVIPTIDEWSIIYSYGNHDDLVAKINKGISLLDDIQDISRLRLYLILCKYYLDTNNSLADVNISIADSLVQSIQIDGDVVPDSLMSELFLCKAKSAYQNRQYSKAIRYAKKSIESKDNIDALNLLIELYADNEVELTKNVYTQYKKTESFFLYKYPFLSEIERFKFSNNKEFHWFSTIPRFVDKYPNDTLLQSLAYNAALISKETNLLLSATVAKSIRLSNNLNNKMDLANYSRSYAETYKDTSEIVRNNHIFYLNVLEKDLLHSSNLSPQQIKDVFCDWKVISSNLGVNELAIEFVEYVPLGEYETDSVFLGAVSIKHNERPKIIRLCKISLLDSLRNQFLNNNQDVLNIIYTNIWEPILKNYSDINKIWFSSSNHLCFINIESALHDDIEGIRVSSTRNFLTVNDNPDFSKIVMYGGLNYDEKEGNEKEGANYNRTAYYIIKDSHITKERVGLSYLEGSLVEVESVKGILSQNSCDVNMYINKQGTESSFKKLSGSNVSLLHIATHGFFVSNILPNIGNRIMRKSGLFMSGAKLLWAGNDKHYYGDDGILLSEEIENLDFCNLNLLVLSACKTGLGVQTSDGIYGMQRAFKKAGAQTIIMSLWDVDDSATALMMTTFYKELINTKSKHKAFKKAQQYVRSKYPDPYYWASFIMLD